MSDHAWLELCEVSASALQALEAQPLDVVCLQLDGKSSLQNAELTTVVLEVVPSVHLPDDNIVYLHPLLYECLMNAASDEDSVRKGDVSTKGVSVSIAPLPLEGFDIQETASANNQSWTVSRVTEVIDLPASSGISITSLYCDDNDAGKQSLLELQLSSALEGRLVRTNSLLALPTLRAGLCLVVVTNIQVADQLSSNTAAYRVGGSRGFTIDVDCVHTCGNVENGLSHEWDHECPGYDDLLADLISLSQLTGVAAPAGVLLTGCTGVGKSRLASCLANHVSKLQMYIHWVSAQDLLVRASWATESDLLALLLPPLTDRRCVVVLDDLQVIASTEEEPHYDPELLLVRNSILQSLDRAKPSTFVLGICHVASHLPKELVRVGRLEKEISMPPPTQFQRELILMHILEDVEDEEQRRRWVEALAPQTAGCVASDLRRLCASAWTKAWSRSQNKVDIKWNDLREAARTCIPSQLAQLDVTKTASYPHGEEDGSPDLLKVHEWSWRNFGGYQYAKKRLFRTVVIPWRRYVDGDERGGISPPSGVIFHGPPGNGKTLAASCLASSLGLHIVKVRASDVLDQWLGGSEAAIRSLFARARAASPCILFFDEIDAIACNRDDDGASVDVTSRVLTTFLNEMDGISSGGKGRVLVVACTNRFEALDAALLRPGRLDEHVLLQMPDVSDVCQILNLHLAKVPLHLDVDVEALSELMVELDASGADIEGVCRDACSLVIRDESRRSDLKLSQNDLMTAVRGWRK